ncbi:MAG: DUF3999 family protein [Cyclobacteriaceae bacterium]|nr:DUF3999 family protein [Cyclobacteriaceae bacterium]
MSNRKKGMNLKFVAVLLIMLLAKLANAQEHKFEYQCTLEGIADTWHTINIPTDAYSKLNSDFSDLRIIGITASGDTIEAPYILKVKTDAYDDKPIDFNLINEVSNSQGYFYTFELQATKVVNSIELAFDKSNFNWLLSLEGSQNQQEWFTILDKSRIVAIENENTSYKYTTLTFNNVSYKYMRLKIPASKNPHFQKATMKEKKVIKGIYNTPNIHSFKVVNYEDENKTEVLLSLQKMMPISFINLQVTDAVDYYRPLRVEYAIDSIKNNTGWHYLYKHLFNGTLSSLNKKGCNFSNQVLKHVKITVKNRNNEPLHYDKVELHGNPYHLIARFTTPATYYLVYGNTQAMVPDYDITRFEENIPTQSNVLQVGKEVKVEKQEKVEPEPLFTDAIWLWAIMIFAIFILGWFSFKMLKNN